MVKIRLSRGGKKKSPFYFIVATDSRRPRDSNYIEKLGTYNPFSKELKVNEESLKSWLEKGSMLSDSLKKTLTKNGIQV